MRACIVLMALLPAVVLIQQPFAPTPVTMGTAAISGAVMTDDTTSVPVRGATVTLRDGARLVLIAVTDDNGAFGFTSLPEGRFTLSAAKGGYLPAKYGARRPGGTGAPLVLIAGEQATDIIMRLLKGSVLTGTVVGENGQPIPDVKVAAFKRTVSWRTGDRTLEAAPFASSQVTDDRGRYRIWALEAGEYAVSALASLRTVESLRVEPAIQQMTEADIRRAQQLLREPVNARSSANASATTTLPSVTSVAYTPIFFPSATSPGDATLVTLGPHEERDGINIQLRLVPTATIQGVVTGPNGSAMNGVQITMMDPGPSQPGVLALASRNATSDREGKYGMSGIAPGTYTIVASAGRNDPPLWAVIEVLVAGRDVNAPMVLMPGLTISGRLVFEGASPPPRDLDPLLAAVSITSAQETRFMTGLLPPRVASDGTFRFTVVGGKHRVGAIFGTPLPSVAGWSLKSVVIDGADVSDVVFDITKNIEGAVITFTDRGTELSGLVIDAAGRPAPEHALLIFSADQRLWLPRSRRTREARPDANGRFLIRDLPSGEYLIAVLSDVDPSQWNDPAFLADLAAHAPIKITLGEGEKKIQNIKIGGGYLSMTGGRGVVSREP